MPQPSERLPRVAGTPLLFGDQRPHLVHVRAASGPGHFPAGSAPDGVTHSASLFEGGRPVVRPLQHGEFGRRRGGEDGLEQADAVVAAG